MCIVAVAIQFINNWRRYLLLSVPWVVTRCGGYYIRARRRKKAAKDPKRGCGRGIFSRLLYSLIVYTHNIYSYIYLTIVLTDECSSLHVGGPGPASKASDKLFTRLALLLLMVNCVSVGVRCTRKSRRAYIQYIDEQRCVLISSVGPFKEEKRCIRCRRRRGWEGGGRCRRTSGECRTPGVGVECIAIMNTARSLTLKKTDSKETLKARVLSSLVEEYNRSSISNGKQKRRVLVVYIIYRSVV